ncbi:MAG: DciA family protein [Thermodesulfobacteriota bacterium]
MAREKPFRPGGLTRMDSLLAGLIRERHWERQVGLHAIFAAWPKLVGAEIARRAVPQVIRGTVLWVGVTDSVWMQQLHLLKQELLERINAGLTGSERVSDLRFQLETKVAQQAEPAAPAQAPAARPLDQGELRDFEAMVGAVADPGLRRRLVALWKKAHQFPAREK